MKRYKVGCGAVAEFLRGRSAMPGMNDLSWAEFPAYSEDFMSSLVVDGVSVRYVEDDPQLGGWSIYDAQSAVRFRYESCTGSHVEGIRGVFSPEWDVFVWEETLGENTSRNVERMVTANS
jgi:hypothetical protein